MLETLTKNPLKVPNRFQLHESNQNVFKRYQVKVNVSQKGEYIAYQLPESDSEEDKKKVPTPTKQDAERKENLQGKTLK